MFAGTSWYQTSRQSFPPTPFASPSGPIRPGRLAFPSLPHAARGATVDRQLWGGPMRAGSLRLPQLPERSPARDGAAGRLAGPVFGSDALRQPVAVPRVLGGASHSNGPG